jgi:hypothetical protein
VAKEGFDYDLASLLVEHIHEAIKELESETKKSAPKVKGSKVC